MKTARGTGRFTRRTGFASVAGLALNFGDCSCGSSVNGLDWMVVGEIYD